MQALKVQLLALPLDHHLLHHSYDIIIPKWLLEYVYIENMLGMKLSYMFELRSEICCASTSLPCATFELQRKYWDIQNFVNL